MNLSKYVTTKSRKKSPDSSYYRSNHFVKLKDKVIGRSVNCYLCECRFNRGDGVLHHLHYETLWGETPFEDVFPICHDCHSRCHYNDEDNSKIPYIEWNERFSELLTEYSIARSDRRAREEESQAIRDRDNAIRQVAMAKIRKKEEKALKKLHKEYLKNETLHKKFRAKADKKLKTNGGLRSLGLIGSSIAAGIVGTPIAGFAVLMAGAAAEDKFGGVKVTDQYLKKIDSDILAKHPEYTSIFNKKYNDVRYK